MANYAFIIVIIIMILILGSCSSKKKDSGSSEINDTYKVLRENIFRTNPDKIGLNQANSGKVWGFVMETGVPEGVYTLVVIADGSVSIYFSSGGGCIGLGQNEEVRNKATKLINLAEDCTSVCLVSEEHELPKLGMTSIYLLTWNGILATKDEEQVFGNGRSKLSSLFHEAHSLIADVRVTNEDEEANGHK